MGNEIILKRGLKSQLPALATGEPGFALDTGELFIGNNGKNVSISTRMAERNVWESMTPANQSYKQAIKIGTKVYCVPNSNIYSTLSIYDTITGLWTTTPTSTLSLMGTIAHYDGIIYAQAYMATSGNYPLRAYNIASDTWSNLANHPYTNNEIPVFLSYNGKLVAFTYTNDCYVYNIASNSWSSAIRPTNSSAPYNFQRSGAVDEQTGLMYIFTTHVPESAQVVAVNVFNPATEKYTSQSTLSGVFASAAQTTIIHNNEMYLIGGFNGSKLPATYVTLYFNQGLPTIQVLSLSNLNVTLRHLTPLPMPTTRIAAYIDGDYLNCFGGNIGLTITNTSEMTFQRENAILAEYSVKTNAFQRLKIS